MAVVWIVYQMSSAVGAEGLRDGASGETHKRNANHLEADEDTGEPRGRE